MRRYLPQSLILASLLVTACDGMPDSETPSLDDSEIMSIEQAVTSTNNLIPSGQATMRSDSNADGVANGFVKLPGSRNTVTYTVSSTAGQTINITAATGSAAAAVQYSTFITPNESSKVDAAVDVKLIAAGGVGARLDVLYYNGTQFLSRVSSPLYKLTTTPTTAVYKRIVVAPHFAPTAATAMKVAVLVVHLASGTKGQATFRNIGVASEYCYSGAGTTCVCGGTWQCNGQCGGWVAGPPPAEYGQDCGCGNTWQCNGTCGGGPPIPAEYGQDCGCGNTVQCDGSCSGGNAIPAEYNQPCGCGGLVQCDGRCSIPCPL